ncbi:MULTISPECIES: sulfite exporter TauE/SafE family protein [Aliivibrio]|uniref:Sulfite exporter TauE/SafE family protein n=1 Tax=Aliivibrio finisterrensis TaxID=511998 RepID=A0A4Q5KZ54_9GAMM|nr:MULTISPECIES: sulfite exporter TauE/SafE family protein [Aliivibrio]MDD9178728.1 sulfite exporter TauE/SafE family protein [Aliivibrio sp. A6]RYU52437.1 sulfite exporter TauE/SafE family protein [Aliivibrio finisterrensis]RYU55167.1 sulfite exporter TauE/SafE family protein [Aliivibrio finisterrensis]RYU59826.1 sulfite exporter TauE/SafE family protein [Aliivibrio finisterrensis]RYU65692.1 sulfite exporter TauE/SafE family protein [Aliivibrio finisterrensis]
MNIDLLGAFLVGMMGAGHCIGMCGGISAVISMNTSNSKAPRWLFILLYNFGRILSYSVFGFIIGGVFVSIAVTSESYSALVYLRIFAGILMCLLALYIANWWKGLVYIEVIGKQLWKYISPLTKPLLPLKTPFHAIPFGFLWGWLPCGLVYSTLSWAAVSGGAINGSLIMFAFGIGTLPAMFLVGVGAHALQSFINNSITRNISALLLLTYGIHTVYIALHQLI